MSAFDERHSAPPSVAPSAGRRIRGRPRQTASRLSRRPRVDPEAAGHVDGGPGAGGEHVPLPEWHTMTEPEYTLAWEQLRDWTTWLVGRYRLVLEDRLPVCWPQHPELIEELWALRAWRTEAYGPEGAGQSAVYWHQALVAFLGHVSIWWAGGCRAGHANLSTDLSPEQTRKWADADPLVGLPQLLRLNFSEVGAITMPELKVLTAAQMRALTSAGLAHPQHESIAAFTYYDGSWWAFSPREDGENAMWFRADDVDLTFDNMFDS